MKYIIYLSLIVLAFISCTKVELNSQNISDEIEDIALPYIITGERVGMAIGTYDNEETNFYAYGVKNLDNGGTIDENTMFEIGSITKTFTAIALAKFHLQGQLSLDDELQKFFDDKVTIPTYDGKKITLKHMVNHTSSLPREPENLNPENEESYFDDYTIDDFYDFMNSYTLPRAIGSESEYSNIGMGILGYVLKESRSKSYIQLIKDEILSPLGMSNTVLRFEDLNTSNITQGYAGNQPMPQFTFSEVFEGAGVLCSNMTDMWKFIESQLKDSGNDLLNQAINLTHVKTTDKGTNNSYTGLAWFLTTLDDGQEVIWHNGGTISYNSFIGFNKSTGKGVVVLMNSANSNYSGEVKCGFEIMKALIKY